MPYVRPRGAVAVNKVIDSSETTPVLHSDWLRSSIGWQSTRVVALLLAIGCDANVSAPRSASGTGAALAKAAPTSSVSLSSVSPDSASILTTLDVKVNGSGFAPGMAAVWQLNGVADSTQIKTNSTTYVSSKQLVANITISGTATVASWDVAVYSGTKTGVGSELSVLRRAFKIQNPTSIWYVPLNDAGLSFKSDYQFSNGTYSVYQDGVCGVTTTISTQDSTGSGDAKATTQATGRCSRKFTLVYPDGFVETYGGWLNLREIENVSFSIPIGATVERQLHIVLSTKATLTNNGTRCGGLVFGYGVQSNIAQGSDSVLVTRLDASTWHVFSQTPPHNLASCQNNGQLYPMTVDFVIGSSRPLP